MKFASLAAAASLSVALSAHAAIPTVTVNEFGVGTYTDADGFSEPITAATASDPGPGGKGGVLRYSLPISAPTAGDLHLLVPPGGPGISEIIRFGPSTVMYFYSGGDLADSLDSMADIGLPDDSNANIAVGIRGSNTFTYTPTIGQPGYDPGGFIVTYRFITEVSAVPEPASLGLLAVGALLLRRRRA